VELDFWKEARAELDSLKPLFWLGEYDELDNPDYAEVFDASYTWRWMHRAKDFYQKKWPLDSLLSVLDLYEKIGDHSMRAWFTTNHDENSWNGTEYEKYGDMARALAVFSATWKGVPLLYSGQEIPNKKRLKFFEKDPIDWTGEKELEGFYQTLLRLKAQHPALRGGDPNAETIRFKELEKQNVLAYMRKKGEDELIVILNLSVSKQEVKFTNVAGLYADVFSGKQVNLDAPLSLEAWEGLVLVK
jgi:glycosidase